MSTQVFLSFVAKRPSLDQFGTFGSFLQTFLYFDIQTISLILNLETLLLISLLALIYVLNFTTGLILIVL